MHIYKVLSCGKRKIACKKCSGVDFQVRELERYNPLPVRLTRGSSIAIICKKCKTMKLYTAEKNEAIVYHVSK